MKFIQIIEFQTSKYDEIQKASEALAERFSKVTTATFDRVCADRDKPGTYCVIVEFPSYEEAMKNNELPETAEMAAAVAKFADGPPTFRNLDVVDETNY